MQKIVGLEIQADSTLQTKPEGKLETNVCLLFPCFSAVVRTITRGASYLFVCFVCTKQGKHRSTDCLVLRVPGSTVCK